MTRLPEVTRDAVAEELREAFDALVADSGGTVPLGPGAVAALSPEMALRRRPLSNYVRWELTLPQHVQELAILATARHMDCAYVWNAHSTLARKAGVSAELVDAMRERAPLPAMAADESAVVGFVTEILSAHRVSAEAYDAALSAFGTRQTVDLIALVGQYVTNACFLNAFEIALPETAEPVLPV